MVALESASFTATVMFNACRVGKLSRGVSHPKEILLNASCTLSLTLIVSWVNPITVMKELSSYYDIHSTLARFLILVYTTRRVRIMCNVDVHQCRSCITVMYTCHYMHTDARLTFSRIVCGGITSRLKRIQQATVPWRGNFIRHHSFLSALLHGKALDLCSHWERWNVTCIRVRISRPCRNKRWFVITAAYSFHAELNIAICTIHAINYNRKPVASPPPEGFHSYPQPLPPSSSGTVLECMYWATNWSKSQEAIISQTDIAAIGSRQCPFEAACNALVRSVHLRAGL